MRCLILVDIQNDFLPGGALAVPEGDLVVPVVNRLIPQYDLVVATQDWHPENHRSFAANHPGRNVFEQIDLNGLPQTLWPVHCVQNTGGACFATGLEMRRIARVFPKGTNPEVDSYSGFFDNGGKQPTGMGEWLKQRGVEEIHVCGLATDYCVKFTALDGLKLGFKVSVIEDACRGINLPPGSVAKTLSELQTAGATIANSKELP